MQFVSYLTFDGHAEAAFDFYARCLGGKVTWLSRYGEAPPEMPMPPEMRDKVMHIRLEVGDQVLMASDAMAPQCPYEPIKGCSVSIQLDSTAEAERIFNTLAEGGQVQMPIGETFWAARFGALVDRYGVPWMINCPHPQ